MTRIALLVPIVLLAMLGTPLDGSAQKASRGSLSWLAALGDRDALDLVDTAAGAEVGGSWAGAEDGGPSAEAVPSADGQVTLVIVVPADAPAPGDPACDPSYPQLCIPCGAEDLDCHEMGVAGFEVLAPDRHALDHDRGGLGCER